jgi:hypothetical protein
MPAADQAHPMQSEKEEDSFVAEMDPEWSRSVPACQNIESIVDLYIEY